MRDPKTELEVSEDPTLQGQPEKKHGWQILMEAAEEVLAASPAFKYISAGELDRIYSELRGNCLFRQDEIIPGEQCDEIIQKVIETAKAQGHYWYDEIYDFVIAQAGQEAIDNFLSQNPEWVEMACPCGNSDHLTVATKEFCQRATKMRRKISQEILQIGGLCLPDLLGNLSSQGPVGHA